MSKNDNIRYKSAFKFFFKFIKPHMKWYLTAVFISFILIGINIVQTKVTSTLVDESMIDNGREVIKSLIMFILIIALNILLTYIISRVTTILSALVGRDIKRYIYNKLLISKYEEVEKFKSGDMLNTINSDTTNLCDFIESQLINIFSQIVMATVGFTYLLLINPLLCLITFAYTPIGMFFTLSLNKRMNELYPISANFKGEALSVIEQALSCIPIIKSFMAEKQIMQNVRNQLINVYDTDMKISVYSSLIQPACYTTSCIPRILYLFFGGNMVIRGELSIGTYVAIYNLLDYIIGPTVYFPFMLNSLNKSIASIKRISRLENMKKKEGIACTNKVSKVPYIKIKNLYFGYEEKKDIIKNLCFEHCGTGIIALCGSSGSGKTTLLDLISGLYDSERGYIELGGNIGIVSQESYVFSKSIMENVRYGNIETTDEEVVEACKKAGAHKFIKSFQRGYDTIIGDGNNNLSGGQRQRISLARIILNNSDIWLLDEPTSALDSDIEKFIVDTVIKESKEKLIIVSTHREALIECANVVWSLEGVQF